MPRLPGRTAKDAPTWIETFVSRTAHVSWEPQARRQSLDQMFAAAEELAIAEIRYYHVRRGWWRWLSGAARFLAWIFGSIGLVMPLLAAARGTASSGGASGASGGLAAWGYVMLAIAGAFIAANALFGGTSNHTRYMIAQLALERLVMAKRVEWQRLRAGFGEPVSEAQLAEALTLVETFGSGVYAAISEESSL
ncbi:MAG: SLATT domain-containing protein, partial [Gemmatirosa sp.]|nr:SLATT domain-containing protein [Gemmatirosa sp.]